MPTIATITMNPTLDVSYDVERLEPTRKLRSHNEHYDPGGGGINVARVFVRLGGNAVCHYLSGGATGVALDGLLDLHQLVRRPIRIAGATRVACTVHEMASGKEFRFVPEGPEVAEAEWRACLDQLASVPCDYLVASGSLPRGVPADFYAVVARIAQEQGFRFVLDSSGEALKAALAGAPVHLVKPNEDELEQLAGRGLETEEEYAAAAMAIVERGAAEFVAVTLGDKGGLLASKQGAHYLPAIPVEAKSAVGAGDSFLAAMVFALANGSDPLDALRYGMAAGSAAVLTPGTDLCRVDDIERLYAAETR
ncbi:1-phosphofructokinase family hexose kinase [Altererythrobacter sp. CC-YST694]|uniref:1-phosphofructokinase family hexose kinase n=1 Tax=Altererythrobacter sp. CC-YST694 TaxID=2755038 RepID=UPI001D01A19F|nr:1-phosphofructokinase family hexose kinase [Altererythrobacter sp. CC-YST694]MCB5425560.1 1-phosphofructokinase family hexose kinase [Altererythrobacter sp. CC-YST694]